MKIGEKLDELRKNVLRDTSDLIAGDSDSLWSDETLLRYLKAGERRFARQTLCIRDGDTAAVTRVRLKEGQHSYPLHESVIAVLSAVYDVDTYQLPRSGVAILTGLVPPEYLAFDPSVQYTLSPGRPAAYQTDETLVYASSGRVTLSVYPDPGTEQEGKYLQLRVLRTPLTPYTLDQLELESEIPEDYELDPLQWAAHLATRNTDGDAGASVKSESFKTAFEQAVGNAIRETKRKIFANMTHRFGMGGFSWTR